MYDGKGYLIPANPQPAGLRCIKLWIPDDDLYLYALSGSIQFLAKWNAWERDTARRGKLAAQAWWEAWEYTQLNGWLNCGDDIPPEDEMPTTINNYVNCGGCGCGDNVPTWQPPGGGNPVVITLPTTGDDHPIPLPPANPEEPPPPFFPDDPTWPDRAAWEAARCTIANYGWRLINNFLFNMEQADNRAVQVGAIVALFIAYAPAAILARIGSVALLEIVAGVAEVTAITGGWSAFFGEIQEWWQEHQEDIVCWGFQAIDSQELSATLITQMSADIVAVWEDLPGWSQAIVDAATTAMVTLFNPAIANLLYNYEPPPYFVPDIDCDDCELPTEYIAKLYDKDGVLYKTFAGTFGVPLIVDKLDSTLASGGTSYLLLFRFESPAATLENVLGSLTDLVDHTPPTNSNHPFTLQYSINDGEQNVNAIALNNTIPPNYLVNGWHKLYLHSNTQFGCTLTIDEIVE